MLDVQTALEASLWTVLEVVGNINSPTAHHAQNVIGSMVARDVELGMSSLPSALRILRFLKASGDLNSQQPAFTSMLQNLHTRLAAVEIKEAVQLLSFVEEKVSSTTDARVGDGEDAPICSDEHSSVHLDAIVSDAIHARIASASTSECVDVMRTLVTMDLGDRACVAAVADNVAQRIMSGSSASTPGNDTPAVPLDASCRLLASLAKLDVWPDGFSAALCKAASTQLNAMLASGGAQPVLQPVVVDVSRMAWGLASRMRKPAGSRRSDSFVLVDDVYVDVVPSRSGRVRVMLDQLSGEADMRDAFDAAVRFMMVAPPAAVNLQTVSMIVQACANARFSPPGFAEWAMGPHTSALLDAVKPQAGGPQSVSTLCAGVAALGWSLPAQFRASLTQCISQHAASFELRELSTVAYALSTATASAAAPSDRVFTVMCAAIDRELVLRCASSPEFTRKSLFAWVNK